jgi:uncharacterized sulfatase
MLVPMARGLETTFVAWAVGALVGALSLLSEALVTSTAASTSSLAAYSLVGGFVAVASRALLATFMSAPSARVGTLGAVAAFGSLHSLYYLNVYLLASEHFLSPKSLLLDGLVVLPVLAITYSLARHPWAHQVRAAWGAVLAAGGAALLTASIVTLAVTTPDARPESVEPGAGPDLLLIVLDSVRADRAPAQGLHPATPELSKLHDRARVFSSAWAASSWTVPSVTVMLAAQREKEPTLSERLQALGYRTACFTDNPHLTRGVRLLRGCGRVERSVSQWRAPFHRTAIGATLDRLVPGSDEALAAKAVAWMGAQRGPFFLYVHLMDSHTPYRFPPLDGRRRSGRRIEFPRTGMPLTAHEGDSIRARYDGGVHSADRQAGRILAAAAARGRPFVAIVTADHGESLGESGRWFHGGSLAPELLAVPLIIVGDDIEAGIISSPVGHVAIPSTLLAAALAQSTRELGPDLRQESGPGLVEGGLPPFLAYRLTERHKLVLDTATGHRALFDRLSDPAETRDIAARAREVAETLAQGLTPHSEPDPPSPEQIERLRALGYAGY